MSADADARRRVPSWIRNAWMVLALFGVFAFIGGFAFLFRSLVFQPFSIPANSMAPNVPEGDFVFAAKFAYGYSRYSFAFGLFPFDGRVWGSEPRRGDIVIFKYPPNPETDYIKRVIGLPGEKIQMIDGVLHINNEPVTLIEVGPYEMDGTPATLQIETLPAGKAYYVLNITEQAFGDETRAFIVPAGHYFMLGDNRDNSSDSRFDVGFVPFENLVGRVDR